MKFIFLFSTLLFSQTLLSSEIQSTTQHIQLKKQDLTGWQQDLMFKTNLNQKLDIGFLTSYLERFSLYDHAYGAFLAYRINDQLALEARYTQGIGNLILPKRESTITAYFALMSGIAPFFTVKDTRYSDTKVQSASLGLEIEKWTNIILVPQVLWGKSKFKSNGSSESVYSYGLKAIYYVEEKFSLFAFAYKGLESSQGIIGSSNILIRTTTGGLGGSYYFLKKIKAELTVDHTDYRVLNNQFLTTTLNLSYKF